MMTNMPFLNLSNTMVDARENGQKVKFTQIDAGLYTKWLLTNASVINRFPTSSSNYPTILYIDDQRSNTSTQLPAVRLTNGTVLAYNGGQGFTVATPDTALCLGKL